MTNDNPLTFVANKDGTIVIKDSEGKDVRYAKESDLLAVKGSAEALEKQAAESQKTHQAEITTATTDLSTVRNDKLQAEAKIEELEKKVTDGAGTAEELAQAKKDLEAAKTSGEELTTKALEYRRTIIVATYGIPADAVKDMKMEQLDNYETAVKSILATRGIGNYAIGGTGGGPSAPLTPIEQAKIELKVARQQAAKKRAGDLDYTQ